MTPPRRSTRLGSVFTLIALATLGALWCLQCTQPRVIGAHPLPTYAPAPTAEGPTVTFLAVGDTGTGDPMQQQVADGMAQRAELAGADFVLLLGDNFYPAGVRSVDDAQWQSAFVEPFADERLQIPFYAILGNHDHEGDPESEIGWSGDERWRMPAAYYTFQMPVGAEVVQFFMLDTEALHEELPGHGEQVLWLARELAESAARWKIVAGHHPFHSGGTHDDNPELEGRLGPLLEEHGVDLYLCAHDHHRAWMEAPGLPPQVISGAGSHPRKVRWTDETVFAGAGLGFVWIRVEPDELWIEFLTAENELEFSRRLTPR